MQCACARASISSACVERHVPLGVELALGDAVRDRSAPAPADRQARKPRPSRPRRRGCRSPRRGPSSLVMSRPVNRSSAARPWPISRGSIAQAPMSAPDSPTRVNRNAVLRPGWPKRMSLAIARIAPAPAHTPSTAAMIGCGQTRIARTRSPVIRVNRSSPSSFILVSGPMISWTSPPEQKLPPAPADHDDLHLVTCVRARKRCRATRHSFRTSADSSARDG